MKPLQRTLVFVGVRGLEPRAPASQTRCATNCATPRKSSKSILLFYENRQEKSIVFAITCHLGANEVSSLPGFASVFCEKDPQPALRNYSDGSLIINTV